MLHRCRKNVLLLLFVATALLGAAACGKKAAPAPTNLNLASEPAPAAPAPRITIRATSDSITEGESTVLSWEAENATRVRISDLGEVDATGRREVSPQRSTSYTATAEGAGGRATDTVRIAVNAREDRVAAVPATPSISVEEDLARNVPDIYFDYDRADIRADQVSSLQAAVAWLERHPGVVLRLEGHCDERGSDEYNLGLGDRRASAVFGFLRDRGVAESRLKPISYGEHRPACSEANESCWTRNRRVHFALDRPIS